jgi:hypothetical protein
LQLLKLMSDLLPLRRSGCFQASNLSRELACEEQEGWFRFSFGVLQDSRNAHYKTRQVLLIHFVNTTKELRGKRHSLRLCFRSSVSSGMASIEVLCICVFVCLVD